MRIGILQTGRAPDDLVQKHGDYDGMFRRMLDGRGFEFTTYAVLDNEFPASAEVQQGWLITGSKFGVYEPFDWVPRLEDLVRDIFSAKLPLIGVCFGHQIIAQALGGTVEKSSRGWSIGTAEYAFTDEANDVCLNAWHQDQVVTLPEGAKVIGHSDFCPYAMLEYPGQAISVQAHPEFTSEYLIELLQERLDVVPAHIARGAIDRQHATLSSAKMADYFERFLKEFAPQPSA